MHHNVTLPDFLLPFLVGSIAFESFYEKAINGREFIRNYIKEPKRKYIISNAVLSYSQYQEIIDFFIARSGMEHSFFMFDSLENSNKDKFILEPVLKESMKFRILKQNSTNIYQRYEPIRYPIIERTKIYKNNISLEFEFDNDSSLLTIMDHIDGLDEIKIECEYYIKVRFSDSFLNYHFSKHGGIKLENIGLHEVLDV